MSAPKLNPSRVHTPAGTVGMSSQRPSLCKTQHLDFDNPLTSYSLRLGRRMHVHIPRSQPRRLPNDWSHNSHIRRFREQARLLPRSQESGPPNPPHHFNTSLRKHTHNTAPTLALPTPRHFDIHPRLQRVLHEILKSLQSRRIHFPLQTVYIFSQAT